MKRKLTRAQLRRILLREVRLIIEADEEDKVTLLGDVPPPGRGSTGGKDVEAGGKFKFRYRSGAGKKVIVTCSAKGSKISLLDENGEVVRSFKAPSEGNQVELSAKNLTMPGAKGPFGIKTFTINNACNVSAKSVRQ